MLYNLERIGYGKNCCTNRVTRRPTFLGHVPLFGKPVPLFRKSSMGHIGGLLAWSPLRSNGQFSKNTKVHQNYLKSFALRAFVDQEMVILWNDWFKIAKIFALRAFYRCEIGVCMTFLVPNSKKFLRFAQLLHDIVVAPAIRIFVSHFFDFKIWSP